MRVEWSAGALADLDRFSEFLHRHYPTLASLVAREIVEKTKLLKERPLLGHQIGGREEYRQIVLRIHSAAAALSARHTRSGIASAKRAPTQ